MTDKGMSELLTTTTWGGAGLSVVGAITLVQWLAIGGFILAVAGFSVNLWHKIQMVELAKAKFMKEYPDD